jgi:hypothetical protein
MNFREIQQAQSPVADGQTGLRQQGSGWEAPIPPSADVEYANRLGVEYFSLKLDCGEGVLRPRSDPEQEKPG